jgi:hypothetical protein
MAITFPSPKRLWVMSMTTAERVAITFTLGQPVWDVTIPELFIGDGATPGGIAGGMVGPQGPVGPTGPTGPTGPDGPQGDPGPNTIDSDSGAYSTDWSGWVPPNPATANIVIVYNSDTGTYRIYFYSNGAWHYIEVA